MGARLMPEFSPELDLAISTRLSADTTLTGLLGAATNIYNGYFPNTDAVSSAPYVVFHVAGGKAENSMDCRTFEITLVVTFHVRKRPVAGGDSIATCCSIMTRIEGDWHNNQPPGYGIEHWQPTLSTSAWEVNPWIYEGWESMVDDEDMLKYLLTFRTFVSKRMS